MEDLLYKIGLTLIPGIGPVNAKELIAYCGGAKNVFFEKKSALTKIPNIGEKTSKSIVNQEVLPRADEEINFIEKNKIKPIFYLDKEYPPLLKHCSDAPIMLYFKGNTALFGEKNIGIVGTRIASEYGKHICNKIVEDLKPYKPFIVSGLAHGIDTQAHKSALKNELPTIAVLGHGLDMIYPSLNKGLAEKVTNGGGLLTEFISKTIPDRENFPSRNRIIAGMSNAVIVVESGAKGGSLITAEIANSYYRDVFAVPGKITDELSKGCNYLIKTNKASLIQSASDIAYILNWELEEKKEKVIQKKLFVNLSKEQQTIVDFITERKEVSIDEITGSLNMPLSEAAKQLLTLEFEGVLCCMPGKIYKLL